MGLGNAVSLPDVCKEMYAFHRWRLNQISALLDNVNVKLFSEPLSGSFGSLNIILHHIVWAEMVWLGRVDSSNLAMMGDLDVKGMLHVWKTASNNWAALLDKADDADFNAAFVYFTTTGVRFENTLAEIVFHMIDHATYHVGQMMNAVRGFGVDPVPTSFIQYLRAQAIN